MLPVGLHALSEGPVETAAVVEVGDPALDGLEFTLRKPLTVRGRLMESGPGRYFWRGSLETLIDTTCRRCLTPLSVPVAVEVEALFTDDAAVDDPAAYPIAPHAAELVLDDMVREELLLAVPGFPLCRQECRGLCPRCGKDLNVGPCACEPEPDPRWAALRALEEQGPH